MKYLIQPIWNVIYRGVGFIVGGTFWLLYHLLLFMWSFRWEPEDFYSNKNIVFLPSGKVIVATEGYKTPWDFLTSNFIENRKIIS